MRRLHRWLQSVPLHDPVERRNAPMLQLLLVAIGFGIPVLSLLRIRRSWEVGIDVASELTAVLAAAFAWTCFYLVRGGHFRLSANLCVLSSLVLLALAYARQGLMAQLDVQVLHVAPLILGALLVGRRALWAGALAMLLVLLLGAARDVAIAPDLPALHHRISFVLLRSVFAMLVLALVLDRTVSALREALETTTRRGEELARTRDRLEREILEKERSQAQLLHAQKMEAVGRLAGGVAHDFNNILGVILGYAGRAEAALDPRDADAALEGIRSAAQRGAVVTRRLLSLGRDDARHPVVFDAAAALRDTLPMLRQLLGDGVDIRSHLGTEPLPVRLDRSEFELALLNIVANARDAMPQGGVLRINAERQTLMQPSAGTTRDGIAITLTDTGCGMPPEVVARMFDPFFTTKPSGRGTGIGLAVVHRLIVDAGGEIRVDSEPGHGTALRLVFPRADDVRMAVQHVARPRRRLCVLLVEDDEELRSLLGNALREADMDVLAAGRADEALAIARKAERVDAIVSDYDLPDGNADELLAVLATVLPEAQRVLISALDRGSSRRGDGGAPLHALLKPFAPSALVDLLHSLAHR